MVFWPHDLFIDIVLAGYVLMMSLKFHAVGPLFSPFSFSFLVGLLDLFIQFFYNGWFRISPGLFQF